MSWRATGPAPARAAPAQAPGGEGLGGRRSPLGCAWHLARRPADSVLSMPLHEIRRPADLRGLTYPELDELAGEIRDFVVQAVAETGGHLGSNLGAVEMTLALHRVFDSPTDAIVWDTGH